MRQPIHAKNLISESLDLTRWIDAALDTPESPPRPPSDEWAASPRTGLDKAYRRKWTRPEDEEWNSRFRRIKSRLKNDHSMIAMTGNKGAGKTQLAAEIIKDLWPNTATYTTAMALFLRIKDTFKKANETENDIVRELSRTPLLVIDELQGRSENPWEDRLLTEIMDKRYANERPTILISNLTPEKLQESLGDSIADRMRQGGGIFEITGASHRSKG